MDVRLHNRVLRSAEKRAFDLEGKLAGLLAPLLARAGDVAAENFEAYATRHVAAAALGPLGLTAAIDVQSTLTMICVKPTPEQAAALVDADGYPAENLHCTLVFLGEIDGPLDRVAAALRDVAAVHGPLEGVVGGYGQFDTPGGPVGILLPDVPGLVELRVAVTEALVAAEIDYARNHGLEAHITVDDEAEPDEWEKMLPLAGSPLTFGSLYLVRGNSDEFEIPLVGAPPLTASAAGAFCLPAEVRGITDPVRQAVVDTVGRAALDGAGITFHAKHPLFQRVSEGAGKQVTNIARTTQQDVMRAIRASYDAGLSIPDTAKAIRTVMADASEARAVLIARTELAGAVNGASLAAVQIVNDAMTADPGVSGDAYSKSWMTAPGAKFPRHEDYDGLDGQTVALNETFEVGGDQLQYPGDPDGSPEEVCNCFPAETLVETPGLRAAMRRWYDGDLVRIRLSSGDELAATPNHPVLRADGVWVPIGELERGEYLVSARNLGSVSGAPNPDRPPATIGEVYGLANVAGDAKRVALSPPDLHGDGADGEVEVVTVDGSLLLDADAASDEEVMEFGFSLAALARLRVCGGDVAAVVVSRSRHLEGKAAGLVRGDGERTSLPYVETRHAQRVRLGTSADGQADLVEAAGDDSAADAYRFGHGEDGLAALMALPQVVEVKREPFHGYVYNLDTGAGWYTAGTIACRNCRCTMEYVDQAGADVGEVDSLEASAHRAWLRRGPRCTAHVHAPREALIAAGPPQRGAPAPSEVLNIDCDAQQTDQQAPVPSLRFPVTVNPEDRALE